MRMGGAFIYDPLVTYDDVDERGNWTRTYDGRRCRYYWRGFRVPWLFWVMGF